ncbi:MAG: hypothetical protein JWN50_716 [Parcubacteria group bacterium]|nr:hypothetical protein [Parcubacteria group bacterium]
MRKMKAVFLKMFVAVIGAVLLPGCVVYVMPGTNGPVPVAPAAQSGEISFTNMCAPMLRLLLPVYTEDGSSQAYVDLPYGKPTPAMLPHAAPRTKREIAQWLLSSHDYSDNQQQEFTIQAFNARRELLGAVNGTFRPDQNHFVTRASYAINANGLSSNYISIPSLMTPTGRSLCISTG